MSNTTPPPSPTASPTSPPSSAPPPTATACSEALRALRRKLALPEGLGAAGIPRDSLPKLADLAFQDACHTLNPRPCTRDDLLALYEASY
ncbi:MAG: iron-containing alcohol dehydrogenase [Polyangiaceae bacterium]